MSAPRPAEPYPEAPVLDVAGLLDPRADARRACIDAMVRTVERHGVFVATGMPGQSGLDRRANALLRFFELDDSAKRRLVIRRTDPGSPRMYRGYHKSDPARRFAYTEYFDIGPDRPMPLPSLRDAEMFLEPNAWPDPEPAPGWRAAMEAHFEALESLGMAILRGFADALGLPAEELDARFAGGNSTLRLLRYPPRPATASIAEDQIDGASLGHDPSEPPMAIGRHTDGCCLSLLWQREPGLQGEAPDGRWYAVPQVPDSLSVHLGDVFESVTRGRLRATPHRVFERESERRSIGFFVEPKLAASCAPLDDPAHPDRGDLDSYAALLLRRHARYPGYENVVHDPDATA